MYFTNIQGFIPKVGIDTVQFGNSQILHFKGCEVYMDNFFKKDMIPVNFELVFSPFKQIEIFSNHLVYVSESNLINILKYHRNLPDNKKVYVDHGEEISDEILKNIKTNFLNGYKEGYRCLDDELGISFSSLDIKEKMNKLKQIGNECSQYLFFEGFNEARCLYILGYIQAIYFKVWNEYKNLQEILMEDKMKQDIHFSESTNNLNNLEIKIPKQLGIENINDSKAKFDYVFTAVKNQLPDTMDQNILSNKDHQKVAGFEKIYVTQTMSELKGLWMILTELDKLKLFPSVNKYKTENDIDNLIGLICQSKLAEFPNSKHKMQNVNKKYKDILNLLVYATYIHNDSKDKEKFAECLKATFSCFANSEILSIKSNMTANTTKTIMKIKNINSDIAIKTLKKLNELGIK